MSIAQTPLLGEENIPMHTNTGGGTGFESATPRHQVAFTPNPLATPIRFGTGDVSATPRDMSVGSTPLRTPWRDNLSINPDGFPSIGDTPREQRLQAHSAKRALQIGMMNFPKPENNFELLVPEEENEGGDGEERGLLLSEEDAEERDAKLRRAREEEEKRILSRRTQVVRLGLPRPANFDAATLLEHLSLYDDVEEGELGAAQKLGDAELASLIQHNSLEHPIPGTSRPGGAKSTYEIPNDESFHAAKSLIHLELASLVGFPEANTDIDAVCKIPLPPFTSGLYLHDEEEDHPDASHSKQNMRHAMSTSPIRGALDSPLIYLQHPAPLSPPPTLPTPTALLPPAEEDHGDTLDVVLLSSLLGSSQKYHYSCNSALPFSALQIDQNDQSDSAPPNPHLLSPLSPQFVTGISAIGHVNQSPRSPSDGIGATSLEGSELDRSPLGLYSLLLDQTGIPSPASPSFGMSFGMYEEYKCSWTPRSLDSSSNDDGTARYITKSMTTAPHLSYPSPKSSHWPHRIPLHPPSHPPFLSPHISTELPMQSEFPHRSSPSIRYIELNGPVCDGEAPGSQSPTIRTFELPELEEDEDLETGFDSGLGLSLTSFPTMSEISPAPEDSSSRFSSLSHYILPNSPSLITCLPPTSGPISKPTLESDWDTPTSNLSQANFNDAGYDSATPSSMLLLDVNIESSQNIKFNPGRLPSPNTLVESLDSRLSHLPLDSSPSDIPLYADCPEKAQTSEKEAKTRERELVAQVELTDMCGAGEKITSTINVAPVKLPSSSLAVVEAEKAEAKATRKREKERHREVAAIVALTLFGGAHKVTDAFAELQTMYSNYQSFVRLQTNEAAVGPRRVDTLKEKVENLEQREKTLQERYAEL
ncbi:pre-mRNA splicing factor component-domain-containing protein [Lentinula lateritia]|uniref:Pre-mRNA splicing factor component-domain-containing protein n=1 Tax=Lentinula lateritia TaxID=40482 RepID=A0ABQ8VR64_9AGAR|nr:pre-mRNA splicing factor component-domain-containing protein [Lentinula lateritia]